MALGEIDLEMSLSLKKKKDGKLHDGSYILLESPLI
jgi:hypothetical protein